MYRNELNYTRWCVLNDAEPEIVRPGRISECNDGQQTKNV